MLLQTGEKVHIVTRRGFEEDIRRHFIGVVEDLEGAIARIRGFAFVFDNARGEFVKKPSERTSIFNVAESGYIVNVLPEECDVERMEYTRNEAGNLVVCDGKSVSLDINEFGKSR